MGKLIDFDSYPVRTTLHLLLQDKTTKKNIIWATDAYCEKGAGFQDKDHIDMMAVKGLSSIDLRSRTEKALEEQQERTRKKAEVFTPVWLCNKMNNYADEQWFGQKDIFNFENEAEHTWTVNENRVPFDEKRTWKAYVDSRRLEITCGEAPYLVSRYDATTGELILPPLRRIGMLDRKLRVVNENAQDNDEWLKWALRAFQSCYGYEYQGDNLLIARINLIMTFEDYFRERIELDPDEKQLKQFANVIAWNIWQMDGLKDTVPLGKPHEEYHQMSIFDMFEEPEQGDVALPCKIKNWRSNGTYGDTLTKPLILPPNSGFTHTFLGIGGFDTNTAAENALKYIKTKFARCLLGILKITQDMNADKWKYVPLLDFSNYSDINWDTSINEIDAQLFEKFGLNEIEINFIKNNIKPMH